MTISKQDESHRRGATRAPVDRPIKLQFDDSMEVIEGTCRNVSIGGMFILYEHSRPAGSLVRFELELDDSNAIRGLGEVVWMRSKNDFGGPEAGFGLKFRFLEQRDRQQIFKLVSQHIKERLSKRGESEEPPAPSASPPTPSASPLTPPEPLATPPAAPSPPTLAAFPDVDEALAAPSAPAPSAAPPSALPDVDAALAAAELPPADNESPATAHQSLGPIASESASDRPASERAVIEASSAEEDLLGSTDTPLAREVWQPPPPVAGDAQVDPGLLDGSPPAVSRSGPLDSRPLESPLPKAPEPVSPPAMSDPGAIDLDPSVGDTPIYELGLDAKAESRRPSFFAETEPQSAADAASINEPEAPALAAGSDPGRVLLDSPSEAQSEDEPVADPPRREFALLPVLLVLLLSAAAGFYLFQDEILQKLGGGKSAASDIEQEATTPEAPAVAEAVPQGAASAGVPPAEPSAVEAAPTTPDAAPESTPTPAATAPPPPIEATSPAPPPPEASPPASTVAQALPPPPEPAAAPPPAPQPAVTEPPQVAAEGPFFSRLQDITWEEVPGGLRIVLSADGSIPTGRYSYFRLDLDTNSPREVVKLVGVSRPFRQSTIPIGGPGVKQVRVGYHRKGGQNEIHVVIDLLATAWKLTEVRNQGNRLELLIQQ